MTDRPDIDYTVFDRPEILSTLFYPRPEWGNEPSGGPFHSLKIPVGNNVEIGARFYPAKPGDPTILFFHGNGEIVADYDDLVPIYGQRGINFLPADYRGYGRSTGRPGVSSMIRDAHAIFDFVSEWLQREGFSGPLLVMGRSLGSASALEIAQHYQERVDGLIIESGFAKVGPLLELLGVSLDQLGIDEGEGFNIEKIKTFPKPLLVIHARFDHIIHFTEGK
ncbi:MAG: alpha/beta fold hydrolase, partial [Syntrophales bacterium]